ncbi:alpha/beta fold hydrolase [Ureibacillus thermosphaericus]|uniref:alpha/beta fold hydrolase n=1 Tax=Ureibacillus thermosphaericus TaxID=51173 RepID=UPI000BBC5EA6|nr:alpha/beta fold hydrolase [Ureibacillus thermosphaericus]
MIINDELWEDIPLIHCYTEEMNEYSPIVIFLHGFLSAKEHNLHYAYQLVKKGIRVILPDALFHGGRSEQISEEKMNLKFWSIVVNSIQDVGKIYNEIQSRFQPTKIGIAGTSMGGIVTCGCLKKYNWIDAAGVCMGAPGYIAFADYQLKEFEKLGAKLPFSDEQIEQIHNMLSEYDITKTPEQLNNRPVIFWHGKKDKTVPIENALHFYESIRPYYQQQENLQFIVDENQGHKVNRSGVLAVTDFLAKHLTGN